MSELPAGWVVVRLGDIAAEVRNGISTRPEVDGTEPILRISAVRPMRLDVGDTRLLPGTPHQWSGYRIRLDDLLFTRYNGNPQLVGVCARVAEEPARAIVYPDKLIRVRLHVDVAAPAFVEKVVNVGMSRAAVDEKTKTSAGQVGISGSDLKDVPLPLPPLSEQRRIAAKVEALTEKSRRAKEALDAIPPLLERFRQSVLAAAFRGDLTAEWRAKNPDVEPADNLLQRIRTERRRRWEETELAKMQAKGKPPGDEKWKEKYEEPGPASEDGLADLPDGWVWITLGQVLSAIETGKSFACDERPPTVGEIGVIKVSAVTWGEFDEEESKTCVDADRVDDALFVKPGDFLFSRANTIELVGACVVAKQVSKRVMLSDKILRFRFVGAVEQWVLPMLRSPWGRFEIERLSTGNQLSMRNIGQERIREIRLPLPPAIEQRTAVKLIEQSLTVRASVGDAVQAEVKRLKTLNQSILAKAFRGDLVPQDPSDEPASVLLDRIRAERATAAAAKEKKPTKRR
jgi:type I restriction enzyme, S subunit